MLGNEIGDTLAMCHAAGYKDGVHIAFKSYGHRAYGFGNGIAHGSQHKHGMKVAIVYSLKHLRHARRAQMSHMTTAAMHKAMQLILRVLTRKAEFNQRTGRQRSRTFGGKRTAAVQGVGSIHHSSATMCAGGDTAAKVADNKV